MVTFRLPLNDRISDCGIIKYKKLVLSISTKTISVPGTNAPITESNKLKRPVKHI